MSGLGEALSGESCSECARRYADWAVAKVFAKIAQATVAKEIFDATFNAMTRMLMGIGVTAFPLTLKAYKEACWANGWNDADMFQ